MEVYKAINAIQADLAKTGISKDKRGPGFNFRGIDDVYLALAPLLAAHHLCILPRMVSRVCDERQSKSGGALFYVTVEAEFDFVSSEDGSKHTIRTFGEAMDSSDKATNKAMSAAYKYAAFMSFAIPTEGDNDADATGHEIAVGNAGSGNPEAPIDNSPKARAARITAGAAAGDAAGAAQFLADLPEPEIAALLALLDDKTHAAITAAWPK